MFSFDGEFKRTPIQNLGGASQNSDRLTLIRKAQQERQKRAELRSQNNGATIIQSYARSFISRQRVKEHERKRFDEYLAKGEHQWNENGLEYLVTKILFFYYKHNRKDGERLVA